MSAHIVLQLTEAVLEGRAEIAAACVRELLSTGQTALLRKAVLDVGDIPVAAASEWLESMIEAEAQGMDVPEGEASLFCLPFFVDVDRLEVPPVETLLGLLKERAAPQSRIVLASDWAHTHDLLKLTPVEYRRLTMLMHESAADGAEIVDVQKFLPTAASEFVGHGATVSRGNSSSEERLAARCIVGLIVTQQRGCVMTDIVDGDISQPDFRELSAALLPVIPAAKMMFDPAQPIGATLGAIASVQTMMMEERFDAAIDELGCKPVAHICIEDDALVVVMTADGERVLDALELDVHIVDPDWVFEVIGAKSSGTIEHDDRSSMPQVSNRTIH